MTVSALVVASSGIVGSSTAALLLENGWTLHGLARRPVEQAGVLPIAADLQSAAGTAAAEQIKDDAPLWRKIAEREGLAEPDLARFASPWHTDADLGRRGCSILTSL